MPMFDGLASGLLGLAKDDLDEFKPAPNRGDYRRAGLRRGRATHTPQARRRVHPEPHEGFPAVAMASRPPRP